MSEPSLLAVVFVTGGVVVAHSWLSNARVRHYWPNLLAVASICPIAAWMVALTAGLSVGLGRSFAFGATMGALAAALGTAGLLEPDDQEKRPRIGAAAALAPPVMAVLFVAIPPLRDRTAGQFGCALGWTVTTVLILGTLIEDRRARFRANGRALSVMLFVLAAVLLITLSRIRSSDAYAVLAWRHLVTLLLFASLSVLYVGALLQHYVRALRWALILPLLTAVVTSVTAFQWIASHPEALEIRKRLVMAAAGGVAVSPFAGIVVGLLAMETVHRAHHWRRVLLFLLGVSLSAPAIYALARTGAALSLMLASLPLIPIVFREDVADAGISAEPDWRHPATASDLAVSSLLPVIGLALLGLGFRWHFELSDHLATLAFVTGILVPGALASALGWRSGLSALMALLGISLIWPLYLLLLWPEAPFGPLLIALSFASLVTVPVGSAERGLRWTPFVAMCGILSLCLTGPGLVKVVTLSRIVRAMLVVVGVGVVAAAALSGPRTTGDGTESEV